ncbi:MAG: family 16 glycosylhydrolase [Pseudomonadota bacterium]
MVSHTIDVDGEDYVLTFKDEFNTSTTRFFEGHGSEGVWATSFSPHLDDTRHIDRNGEGQYYVDPSDDTLPNPFTLNNGKLAINATPLTTEQQALANGQEYASGLMTTELSFGASSGYVEISADIPAQQGMLSAFWLLPADGDWSDEIDVFEILGNDTDTVHTNVWEDGVGNAQAISTNDLGDGFHTFGLKWTDETITWLVDGQVVREVPNTVDEEMYLALSLAVDTDWSGSPDATTDFSDPLVIDYIRVYELETDENRNEAIPQGEDFVPKNKHKGTEGDDTLYGTKWNDKMAGKEGDDVLHGRKGNDILKGNQGDDELIGGKGLDELQGGSGSDSLVGGHGDDTLDGGAGTDHLWGGNYGGGSGADTFMVKDGMGKDFVHDFNAGDDTLDLSQLGVYWPDVQGALVDQGWATQLNLGHLGGNWSDQVFLIGVDKDELTEDNFDFGTSTS